MVNFGPGVIGLASNHQLFIHVGYTRRGYQKGSGQASVDSLLTLIDRMCKALSDDRVYGRG